MAPWLRVEQGESQEQFIVSGRGILHLSVLIESMRREGFELSISQPRVILKEEDGQTFEPFEEVTIDCDEEHSGTVIEKMNIRNAELRDLQVSDDGRSRMIWHAPSRGLIGYRSDFLTDTRGSGTMNRIFADYGPAKSAPRLRKNGVLLWRQSWAPMKGNPVDDLIRTMLMEVSSLPTARLAAPISGRLLCTHRRGSRRAEGCAAAFV